MNAETILRSDLLDIIFENRNKQYGAYPLRRDYNRRLYQSLGIIALLVFVLIVLNSFQKKENMAGTLNICEYPMPETDLKKIEIEPKAPLPPKQKLPPVASITNDPPRIVPDNQVTDTITHSVTDFDDKVISDKNSDGPAAVSDNQQAAKPVLATGSNTAAEEPAEEAGIVESPEVMPEYPGGIAALIRFLGKNLQVPDGAVEEGQKVRVPVKFVVNKDGELSDVAFLTQTDNLLKKEILRVMAKMPKWRPGLQHGRAVAVYYTIPVIFAVDEH